MARPRPITDPVERTLSRVVVDEGTDCWVFMGARGSYGHGVIGQTRAKNVLTHRLIYEAWCGPVPDGLELDHLCRNPPCCNSDHLEPVTHAVNVARGIAGEVNRNRESAKTVCRNGHEYTPENTGYSPDGTRRCLTCRRAKWKRENDQRVVALGRRRVSR